MSNKGVTAAWLALGVGMAYLALNLVAATQQWPLGFGLPSLVSFNAEGKEARDVIATKAFYGVALLAPVLLVQLALTALHARRKAALSRAERVPVSSALGVMPKTPLGKLVQAGLLALFVLWPAYAIGHFLKKLLSATAVCAADPTNSVRGWDHLWPGPPSACRDRYTVEGLFVYEPFLTPWILAGMGVAVAAALVAALWLVLRPPRKKP